MYRFYISYKNTLNEQIYDDKLKSITWTHSRPKTAGAGRLVSSDGETDIHVKRLEDAVVDLKTDKSWKPIGNDVLMMVREFLVIAGVPDADGESYTKEELQKMATSNPDDWTYMDEGFMIRTRR